VVSDDHSGWRKALPAVLPGAAWQRCYVHLLRNALDYLPRKADDDCLTELRWLYDRHGIEEARRDWAKWLEKWSPKYSKLCHWVEDNIEETFSFYRLPREHHKHRKSTNLLERRCCRAPWPSSAHAVSIGRARPNSSVMRGSPRSRKAAAANGWCIGVGRVLSLCGKPFTSGRP